MNEGQVCSHKSCVKKASWILRCKNRTDPLYSCDKHLAGMINSRNDSVYVISGLYETKKFMLMQ